MVRSHHTQRFPLGTRVTKYFNGFSEPFEGTVDQHSEVTDFYHVAYDDGDSEEMTEDDVEAHLLSLPKPPRAPKPPKTLKLSKSAKSPKSPKLNLSKSAKPLKSPKPPTSPAMKRANSDSVITVSSSVAVTASVEKGKGRPKVLSLNANAPGLARSNSFTEPSSSHLELTESLSVSIPANTVEEEHDEAEDEEEEEGEGEEEEVEEEEEEEEEVAGDEAGDEEEDGTPEEINLLIGKPVERTVTKEGCGIDIVQGAVSSYFPATKMFRVMYFDGECCDLTYKEVFNSIPMDLRPVGSSGKRKRADEETATSTTGKKHSLSSAPSASQKRPKTLDLNASTSTVKPQSRSKKSPRASSPSSGALSPMSPVVRETDMLAVDNVEFNIVRKVLFIIVSTINNAVMETQLDILSSSQLKDQEALVAFVRKDGLVSLADLLTKWEDQVEAEQGILLILKALAVMPGVTSDAIIASKIGKKKLKTDVGVQSEGQGSSKSVNGKSEGDKESHSRGTSSPRRSTPIHHREDTKRDASAKPTSSTRQQDARPSKGKAVVTANGNGPALKRSNSASHLLNLMNSRNGRDASTARRDRDFFGNVVSNHNKRRLGTSHNWRARRSTVVLDQVSKRLTENAQEVEILKTTTLEEDDWQPSKISFAEQPLVCPFDKEVEVSKLRVFRPLGSTKPPDCPLVKAHTGPLRSILRVRLPPRASQENSSAPRSSEGEPGSAPPTVQSTARPALEPIVVPSANLSLSGEASEDGTAESPMFNTSKLAKVVSPTEKRKQGFSPPPCIPASEQPPLDFTEEGEEGEVSTENSESQARMEAAPPAPVLSPIVSDDSSSEDGGDKRPRAETATPASCTTGPKDGGATAMESPVQQATTTSA
ncbi:hypothetical protein PF003_g29321 [Phytophthora fragariae]|nr:hypothetical protein PF003_g29321 [Phytophthora fragariae]